jgi:transcriptional regulator with XRE-family HTH domain
MGMTQQAFASLLGLSFVSVNKWENGGSSPTGLSEVLLVLLANALEIHEPTVVADALRRAGGSPVEVIRTLAHLEKQNARSGL